MGGQTETPVAAPRRPRSAREVTGPCGESPPTLLTSPARLNPRGAVPRKDGGPPRGVAEMGYHAVRYLRACRAHACGGHWEYGAICDPERNPEIHISEVQSRRLHLAPPPTGRLAVGGDCPPHVCSPEFSM